jgi:sugar lactone lactonase YvrE
VQRLPTQYQSTVYRHTARPRHRLLGPCWSPDGRTFYFARTWMPRASCGVRPSTKASSRASPPDGTLDRTVGLPVENATSVIFGGPNLDIAYVTSMARDVKRVSQREREAGGCSRVYGPGVRGIPEPRFRG